MADLSAKLLFPGGQACRQAPVAGPEPAQPRGGQPAPGREMAAAADGGSRTNKGGKLRRVGEPKPHPSAQAQQRGQREPVPQQQPGSSVGICASR